MKILIVDDDLTILESLKIAMEIENYQVETVSKGESAAGFAGQYKPDVILLDYLLSGIDGTQITKMLKQNPKTKDIPIIMFSAYPDAKKIANQIGVSGFLPKPFELDDLFSQITILTS